MAPVIVRMVDSGLICSYFPLLESGYAFTPLFADCFGGSGARVEAYHD